MLRFGFTATALLLAIAVSSTAQAGALSQFLTADNVRDRLEDDDFESFIDLGTAGVNAGDIFIGVFHLTGVNAAANLTPATGGVQGILFAAIDTVDVANNYITFRALTATEYADLRTGANVPDDQFGNVALSNLPATIAATTAMLVYETVDVPVDIGAKDNLGSGWRSINDDAFADVTDPTNSLAYELGFTDGGFAEAEVNSLALPTYIDFRLALNITANNIGIHLQNQTSAQSLVFALDGSALPVAKVHVTGDVDSIDPFDTGAFDYKTDARMVVNAYPEPGSMILAGLGALGVAGAKLRRRKNAA